jgi:hypothetical protein
LYLNSHWGRYCLQTNKTQFKAVKTKEELLDIVYNDTIIVKNIHFYDRIAHVYYNDLEVLHEGGKDSNVALGAFVIAYARVKLYNEIHNLGDRVLYFDTDSIIFINRGIDGEYVPELGKILGDFTNELDVGTHIIEFVSAGPKNYGYLTSDNKKVIKVKGFSLRAGASEVLNYDRMVEIVKNQTGECVNVSHFKFIRNKKDFTMRTEEGFKKYKQVYTKKILLNVLSTIPYNYKIL